jgi:hypothetical protein
MDERKTFLLRIDAEIYAQLRRWAGDELRSLNGQIEYVLREALKKSGRLKDKVNDHPEQGP